ncbi:hypothetical protein BX616_003116 [Lobosporangium transversale]|nr:hypothetical protein BX616_003116 [Lobosporangium transversale]
MLIGTSCLSTHTITSVSAAPAEPISTSSTTEFTQQSLIGGHTTSGNIIRSIGFRLCDTEPETQSTEQIILSSFHLLYNGQANTISLQAEGSTEHELNVTLARIILSAYDRVVYNQTMQFSKSGPSVFRFSGQFSFQETFPVPALLPEQVPKQLFLLPAVEALASIQLYNSQGHSILCTSVPLTNVVSIHSPAITIASLSITAAAIALAAISGIVASFTSVALLTSMSIASVNGGSIGSSGVNPSNSGLSPSVWDVISFCQFISTSGSLNLAYPELLQQWTQNFAWSMGLFSSESWNKAINDLRYRTSDRPINPSSFSGSGEKTMYSSKVGGSSNDPSRTSASSASVTLSDDGNKSVTITSKEHTTDNTTKPSAKDFLPSGSISRTGVAAIKPKLDASKLVASARVLSQNAVQDFQKRQVEIVIPPSSASLFYTDPAPASATAVVSSSQALPSVSAFQAGASLSPSLIDHSLMERHENISFVSHAVSPLHSAPWLQEDYHSVTNALAPPGLNAFGQRLDIPAKNMFMTSFFLFLILILTTSLLALVFRVALEGYAYIYPGKFTKLRRRFGLYYLGSMLRATLLAYFALATMAFYQLTLNDSWAIMLLAAMTLIILFVTIVYSTLRLRRTGSTSLYFDERLKSRYGALYNQYVLSAWWFFIPTLIYQTLKAGIVAFCHGGQHGSTKAWVQIISLLLTEACFTGLLLWKRPFGDKVPNRLNGVLGCIRVLNVAMLAALVKDSLVPAISRIIIGAMIAGTQALMMVVLFVMVFYQLFKTLGQLWKALQTRKEVRQRNKRSNMSSLNQEVLVYVKGDHNHDDYDGSSEGRMASERIRAENESITTLVGMMRVNSNPIRDCISASDNGNGGFKISEDNCKQGTIPVRYKTTEADMFKARDNIRDFIRDSTQSTANQSSLSLDHYIPPYLPPDIRGIIQQSQPNQIQQSESAHGQGQVNQANSSHGEDSPEANIGSPIVKSRLSFSIVPSVAPEEPWVQSAYMTRRFSNDTDIHRMSNIIMVTSTMARATATATPEHTLEMKCRQQEDWEEEEKRLQNESKQSQCLRSSITDGIEPRQSPGSGLFMTSSPAGAIYPRPRGPQLDDRCSIPARSDVLPTFQKTYIPDSLLVPPSPPSQPRFTSASITALATPPPIPPIRLGLHDRQEEELKSLGNINGSSLAYITATRDEIGISVPSLRSDTLNVEPRRFLDEYHSIVRDKQDDQRTSAILAAQRSIHPLSPLHPDYQHPDGLYSASTSSSNEVGSTPRPSLTSSPATTSANIFATTPPSSITYVPNSSENGISSRRDIGSARDTYGGTADTLQITVARGFHEGDHPSLSNVATSASGSNALATKATVNMDATTASTAAMVASCSTLKSKYLRQQTPTSISHNSGRFTYRGIPERWRRSNSSAITHRGSLIPVAVNRARSPSVSTSTSYAVRSQRRSSLNLSECSMRESLTQEPHPQSRPRISIIPLPLSNSRRPLTVTRSTRARC